jgi:hypothetical protein
VVLIYVVLSCVIHSFNRIILDIALGLQICRLVELCGLFIGHPLSIPALLQRALVPCNLVSNLLMQEVPLLLAELLDRVHSLLANLRFILFLGSFRKTFIFIAAIFILEDLVSFDLGFRDELIPKTFQRVILFVQHANEFIHTDRHDETVQGLAGQVETNLSRH